MAFSEKVKESVRKKSDHICVWCKDRQKPTDVHHIIPQAQVKDDTEENAALLCPSCHKLVGANPELRKEVRRRRDDLYDEVANGLVNKSFACSERIRELTRIRDILRKARSEYFSYLASYPQNAPQNGLLHQQIINQAIAACQDAYDIEGCEDCLEILAEEAGFDECSHRCEKALAYIAKLRLTPYLVEYPPQDNQRQAELDRWNWYGNRNRDALIDAIDRVEFLIRRQG
jgi:hypothetical protein